MKICTKCKVQKDRNEFYVRTRHPTGLTPWCKDCNKIYKRSDNWKTAQKRYSQSDKGRLSREQRRKRYEQSDKGRLVCQQSCRRRREQKHNLDLVLTKHDIKVIHERFSNACFNCGSINSLVIDHHYPLSKGFGLSLNNAVLLCKSCNCFKKNKMPEDFYTPQQLKYIKEKFSEGT